jgi:hypothetical protein
VAFISIYSTLSNDIIQHKTGAFIDKINKKNKIRRKTHKLRVGEIYWYAKIEKKKKKKAVG